MKRLCIVGGSMRHQGGLEAFCARATAALAAHGGAWTARWLPADTAYFGARALPGLFRGLRAMIAERRHTDLVWLQFSNFTDLLYLVVARSCGLPVLVTPHLGANSRIQRSPALRFAAASLLRKADGLALLFDGQAGEIALPPSVPSFVLRTFLPERSLTRPAQRDDRDPTLRLIHAGRLSEPKGSFLLVDLCAALKHAGQRVSARLIGRADPATMTALVRHIADLGVGDDILIEPWLDESALQDALAEADILVHLSRLDSYPLIVLEAMAAGTTPLVLDMAGARAMTKRFGGRIVPSAGAVEASAAWLAGCDLAVLRTNGAAMGERVRDAFAWDACVATLVPILQAMIGRAKSAG